MTKHEQIERFKEEILAGIGTKIPEMPEPEPGIPRAPVRPLTLSAKEQELALINALSYFPSEWHEILAPEFLQELRTLGRIYMHRFRPSYEMKARPIEWYPGKTVTGRAIQLMYQNNLDPEVAQFPYELITYGGNGTVFQNWAQYRLTMQYLARMEEDQTLAMYSGHPLGLFPSHEYAPHMIISNGMMIPNYSSKEEYNRLAALGKTMYGQMTAGSAMYIGPQGIVHGTTITIMNAARRYLGLGPGENLAGKVFVSSGLGGMSGAQAKATVIAGGVAVIAEINPAAIKRRYAQGWLNYWSDDLDKVIYEMELSESKGEARSIGYLGNVVDLWEALVEEGLQIDLGSDQTSLHNPYEGGYYPQGLSLEESQEMMTEEPDRFRRHVHKSLVRQVELIEEMVSRGMHFWDYGNAFMKMISVAWEDIKVASNNPAYPSYVEHLMGPLYFDYGFGPFRWVCCSGEKSDLQITDRIAADVLSEMANYAPPEIAQQLADNQKWIQDAEENGLVVGSLARILYAHAPARIEIAQRFNGAIRTGTIKGPIVIGRDHHDTGGTDSPFRETANIHDGSVYTADMAIQNVIGDAMRGASWVSIHNGGGVGWGDVINGGFGLVLDGDIKKSHIAEQMLGWDVNNGIGRRAWARNPGAIWAAKDAMKSDPAVKITLPNPVSKSVLENLSL